MKLRGKNVIKETIKMLFTGIILLGTMAIGFAQPTSEPFTEDVRSTKHNFSANPIQGPSGGDPSVFRQLFAPDTERNVKALPPGAGGTTEVCVFCHTPHGASPAGVKIKAPIWNKKLSAAHYTLYDQVWSKSFEAVINPGAPTGYSRLCLSCHDGTIALGNTINKGGSGGLNAEDYAMEYPTGQLSANAIPGTIPVGEGVTSGNTRVIGTDLRNDHPISMVFDTSLLSKDIEFVDPGPPIRRPHTQSTPTPISPMRRATGESTEVFDTVQCTSCHNPHQTDFPKFLRANRFQSTTFATTQAEKSAGPSSPSGPPKQGQTIICLFCHDKPGWPYNDAELNTHFGDRGHGFDNTRLKPGATDLPPDAAPTVAQRACLGCHDPHTKQGAVRLMREGADPFGNVAIEQTCYQCHQPQATSILQPNTPTTAPDIRTQFFKDREGNNNHGQDSGTGLGSAMDLRIGLGHQPVFVDLPREGVQLGSDNCRPSVFGGFTSGSDPCVEVPPGNKVPTEHAPPTPDTSHVECVDCHNMHRVTRRNRFKGMPGITITGGIVARTLQQVSERREPFVYEICLRCHGNSFNNHVRESLFVALGTGKLVQARGNSPLNPARGVNAGGSNKRKEFHPNSLPFYPENFITILNPPTNDPPACPLSDPSCDQVMNDIPPNLNTSFHPVFRPGRNQSGVLNNYTNNISIPTIQGQLLGERGLSRLKTIHCPDCHNTDLFGTFLGTKPTIPTFDGSGFTSLINLPDYPGPISFDDTRGAPYLRPTDLLPSIPRNPTGIQTASLDDPDTPQGPHGSIYKRILRANYDTTIGTSENKPPGTATDPRNSFNPQNFALCFNCHAEAAFTTPYWNDAGFTNGTCAQSGGVFIPPKSRLTNFYRCTTQQTSGGQPGPNLHYIHLISRTNARCHECHNNVHSNVEAGNTIYVGLNDSRFEIDNPGHSKSTHLINFQPNVIESNDSNLRPKVAGRGPLWGNGAMVNPDDYALGHTGPGCFLRCHRFKMAHNTDAHSVVAGEK